MAFFDYLKQSRSPKQKLIDAIRSNDVLEVRQLLQDGVAPDLQIFEYGEDTVVHQAATRGHYLCIEELVKAGANCDAPNAFGITPIFNAARKGHARAMRVILKYSRDVLGLPTLWYDGKWTEFLHTSATDDVLATLIIASPDVNDMRRNLCSNILFRCVQRNYVRSLYAFFLTGYYTDLDTYRAKVRTAITNIKEAMENGEVLVSNVPEGKKAEYLKGYQQTDDLLHKRGTHSLQHMCRLSIRNSFRGNCNVFFGSEKVILPASLKQYLVFQDESWL